MTEAARPTATSKSSFPALVTSSVVIGLVVISGAAFYFWVLFARYEAAASWGNFGSAVAPFVGLLNAGAVFAALWAVHLQREAGRDAGESTQKQLNKMGEQLAQLARAAEAQEALAFEQAITNKFAERSLVQQAQSRMAALLSSVLQIDAAIAQLSATNSTQGADFSRRVDETRQQLLQMVQAEQEGLEKHAREMRADKEG